MDYKHTFNKTKCGEFRRLLALGFLKINNEFNGLYCLIVF